MENIPLPLVVSTLFRYNKATNNSQEKAMKKKLVSLFAFALALLFLVSGCTVPVQDSPSQIQPFTETQVSTETGRILEAAYALAPGETLEGVHTLTGTITRVSTRYNSKYANITVIIAVPGWEDMPIQCYRLEGQGAEILDVGDTITVTGVLTSYKGTIEFDAGCQLDAFVKCENPPTHPVSDNDDSKEAVALYIHTYGCLPDFYRSKSEARDTYGWDGGPLDSYEPGLCIGGDEFRNYDGQLPDAPGRRYTECDINTIGAGARGAERIVFSNDGLIFYTSDHYETFELLYGEP